MLFFWIVLGLVVGSFLNVCIYRLPRDESVIRPRSRCMRCEHVLGPAELVPVVSYLVQRGRCRHCGQKFSSRYALVELLSAGIFGLCFAFYFSKGDTANGVSFLYFFCSLLVVIFIDLDHLLVLDVVTYPGMAISLGLSIWGHSPILGDTVLDRLWDSARGLLVGGGVLGLIQFLGAVWYRRQGLEAMGLGDVKLAAFTGAFLGVQYEIAALFYAVFLGGIVGVLLIATGIKGRKDYIPFGPALALGAALAPYYGDWLLSKWAGVM